MSEPLLAELNRQLDAKGLMVKTGILIDASLVEGDGRRPRPRPQPGDRQDPRAGRTDLRDHEALVRLRRVRYRSLLKNALQLQLLACAMNLRRALVLGA